jgi:hypothetical protein
MSEFGTILFGLALAASVRADCLDSLREIREMAHCKEVPVQVVAYVNASRHGSLLSDTAGSMRNAVDFSIAESASGHQCSSYDFICIAPKTTYIRPSERGFMGKSNARLEVSVLRSRLMGYLIFK